MESEKELVVEASDAASAPVLMDVDAPEDEPSPASSTDATPDVDIEPWRAKLLSDPSLHEHIRKVARIRGGTRSEVDVVLSDVLFAALTDPNLPRSAGDVRKRLGVVSRNKTIDIVRARGNRFLSMSSDLPRSVEASEASPDLESILADRAKLEKLFAIARERHPQTWRWAVRRFVDRDEVKDIALDARVGERRVRQALNQILATFVSVAATLGVVLLVVGVRPELIFPDQSSSWSTAATRTLEPHEPRPDGVGALRKQATRDYNLGDWASAADEFERAYEMDPSGETPVQAAMRRSARRNADPPPPPPVQQHGDGKPSFRLNP
jgi:hypothetical protein